MLTESPQAPPNNWAHLSPLFAKIPTKFQEKENPVAISVSEEENSDSDTDADSYGSEFTEDSEDNQDDESYIRHRQEKAEQVVTDFLNQVKANKFADFKWPPPSKCPTYKLGMTSPYTDEFWFEKESCPGEDFDTAKDFDTTKDFDTGKYYDPATAKDYDTAKKFLRQVRKSWGYDVDCVPPKWLRPTLFPINMDNARHMRVYGEDICRFARYAIERINNQAVVEIGKTYELVKIEKAVETATTMLLLTLTIKETDSDAEKAIRVAVSSPPGCGTEIEECNLVPSLSSSSSSS